jgi:serine/threonine-protein kinase RsbW
VGANLAEPLVGALLLTSLVPRVDLSRTRDLALFLAGAVLAAPAVGGMLGASTYVFVDGGSGWARFAAQWWVGDGLGVLVVAGAILSLRAMPQPRRAGLRVAEAAVLAGGTVAGAVAVFWLEYFPLVYVPIVLLLALALRAGTRVVAFTGAAIAFIAAEATAEGHRLWEAIELTPDAGLAYLQLAIALLLATALALAAEISQRERAAMAWATSEAARKESELAAGRAEELRRLAEALGRASSSAEIAEVLALHGRTVPSPFHDDEGAAARAAPRDPTRAEEAWRDDPVYREAAGRMARDAASRAELFESEHEARARAELLEQHAAHLAAALTVREVAETTVTDLQAVGPAIVAVSVVRGSTAELVAETGLLAERRVREYPLDLGTPGAEAIRTGEPVEIRSGEEYDARYPSTAQIRLEHGIESVVAAPLRAGDGRTIGAVTAASSEPGWFTDRRKQLLFGVAGQCGLALERALLQAAIEAAAADATLLAGLSDALERETTLPDRGRRLVELLVAHRARYAAVHVLDEENVPQILAEAGALTGSPSEEPSLAEHVAAAIASGETVVPLAGGSAGSEQEPALHVFPLRSRGRTLGALAIAGSPASSEAQSVRARLEREIAARAAVALDNALLYERERDVSHALQLGLLGGTLPDVEGLALEAAYRPGSAALEVGGDWYDSFVLPDGSIALVVGDVVGHGLDAAVTMGQLRGAVRALAPTGSPAEVLARLDAFVEILPAARIATVAYAELEQESGRIRYACAGHPPPLIVEVDGAARYLWGGRSMPLGAAHGEPRSEASDRLEEAATLVLYTDGLIERRDAGLEAGLDRLAVAARAHQPGSEGLVNHVCGALLDESLSLDDDVCVLTLHRVAPSTVFAHSLPASPAELSGLRQRLRSWLATFDVEDEVLHSAVLAVSEAAANAVEHAYGCDGTGTIRVFARFEPEGQLEVRVRDHGSWRPGLADSVRGRGLPTMRAVMDEVLVEHDAEGTMVRMRRQVRAPVPA